MLALTTSLCRLPALPTPSHVLEVQRIKPTRIWCQEWPILHLVNTARCKPHRTTENDYSRLTRLHKRTRPSSLLTPGIPGATIAGGLVLNRSKRDRFIWSSPRRARNTFQFAFPPCHRQICNRQTLTCDEILNRRMN